MSASEAKAKYGTSGLQLNGTRAEGKKEGNLQYRGRNKSPLMPTVPLEQDRNRPPQSRLLPVRNHHLCPPPGHLLGMYRVYGLDGGGFRLISGWRMNGEKGG